MSYVVNVAEHKWPTGDNEIMLLHNYVFNNASAVEDEYVSKRAFLHI